MSNFYYWEKLTFSKPVGKVNFSERIFEKFTSLQEQKDTRYIPRNVYFSIIIFSCLSSTKTCLKPVKGFYQSSLGNKIDFRDIMNVSPNFLAKNWNFKKLRHIFVDERAMITTKLISPCHWKTLVPFCSQKKRPENAFLTLMLNYCKIVQKNKLCHPKQQ